MVLMERYPNSWNPIQTSCFHLLLDLPDIIFRAKLWYKHVLDLSLNGFVMLALFLLIILQSVGEVINLFPKRKLRKMLFLKMFLWCCLWKSFLGSIELWSWAVSAFPEGQSVGEQSVLQAFTLLILFENKGAKAGRGRENTEIKGKRSWKLKSCLWTDAWGEHFSPMEVLEQQKVHHKAGLSFIQALPYLLYFSAISVCFRSLLIT